ncbi:ABC transporter ATP-binding protein [Hoyosella sp. G463]|uniref:ABC transporter ATP-binding protein n=1 Tax=Lolliginicoccus lacisalsi TaxID=2742202 RepID=A0A927J969_9ACTN|nr:dipeptide/oligopeptide/nickel ABC transporter ATP-binding protein [Lolliginicoccus lacisalsi]MBD8504913.1 ABC transporter ATP-binding protein [Lolliginicoccus lacisalsi]
MWSARRISVDYPGTPVLEDVSIDIAPGEIVGLGGPSGCGKTTLARAMLGLRAPHRGTISLDGHDIRSAPRGSLAMLFQAPRSATNPRHTLRRIIDEPQRIRAPRGARARSSIEETAATAGLTPDLLDRYPHEVSDGQLQRACLARALVQRPRYLVCDEATAMLDPVTTATLARQLVDHAREHHMGILLISHDIALLGAVADRALSLPAPGPAR